MFGEVSTHMSKQSSLRNTHTQSDRSPGGTVDQIIKKSVLLAYRNYRDRNYEDVHTILDSVLLTNKFDITVPRQLEMLKRLIGDTIKVEPREEYMKESFTQFFEHFVADHLEWRHKHADLVVDDLRSKFQDISSLVPMLERLHDRLCTLEARINSN